MNASGKKTTGEDEEAEPGKSRETIFSVVFRDAKLHTIFVSEVVPLMPLAGGPAVSRATWHGPSKTVMLGISPSRGSVFSSMPCCPIQHHPNMRLKSMSRTEAIV